MDMQLITHMTRDTAKLTCTAPLTVDTTNDMVTDQLTGNGCVVSAIQFLTEERAVSAGTYQ